MSWLVVRPFSTPAPATIAPNESAMNAIAASIFVGVDGSFPRSPSHVQARANTGAKRTMSAAFTDCHHSAG